MKLLQESIEYIKEITENKPFEIWAINNFSDEIINIYGENKVDVEWLKSRIPNHALEIEVKKDSKFYIFNFPEDIRIVLVIKDKDIDLTSDDIDRIYQSFFSTYENELINIKNREVKILLDSIVNMTATIDREKVLANILKSAINILVKIDSGYIQIYDKRKNSLDVEVAYGFDNKIFDLKAESGDSITGKVFEDGKFRIYNSRQAIVKGIDPKEKNDKNIKYIEESIGDRKLYGFMSVPIQYRDTRLGVITLIQSREGFPIIDSDAAFLESFASQAAVIIRNYELYNEVNENLKSLEILNEELSEKNRIIDMKNRIYREISKLSLTNERLSRMGEVFSNIIGKPIIFYNKVKREIEFNNLNLDEDIDIENIIKIYTIHNEGDFFFKGLYYYLVKNDDLVLGYIITDEDIRKDKAFYTIFQEGLTVLTLEVMKKFTLIDGIYKKTHEYFTRMLKATDTKQLNYYVEQLNIPLDETYTSLIVQIRGYNNLQMLEFNLNKLIDILEDKLEDYKGLIYGFHNKVNILLYSVSNKELDKIKGDLTPVVEKWNKEEDTAISIGIGGSYKGVENILHTYEEGEKALKYLVTENDRFIVSYDKIGINSLFVNQDEEEINKFLEETLGPLRSKEGQKSSLEETLFTYIKLNKSAAKTADKLYIHINTLYKRLEKIEEVLNIDFNKPDDNLKIQLACHLASEGEEA